MASNENLPPDVIKKLAKELKNLKESPPEGIEVCVNACDFSTIYADIEGPASTPYENGVFRMKLLLTREFPCNPPKGYFLTKIFHPNIASSGEICVNTLKRDWKPDIGLRHILLVVRCLLIEPFPESALNEQASKMLLEDYNEYARIARLYTGIHAKPKQKVRYGAISDSTTALNVEHQKALQMGSNPLNFCSPRPTASPNNAGNSRDPLASLSLPVGSGSLQRNTSAPPANSQADKRQIAIKKSLKRL